MSDSTSAILHECTQLKYSTAGSHVHNHLFVTTFRHSKVTFISEAQLYILVNHYDISHEAVVLAC